MCSHCGDHNITKTIQRFAVLDTQTRSIFSGLKGILTQFLTRTDTGSGQSNGSSWLKFKIVLFLAWPLEDGEWQRPEGVLRAKWYQ